METDYGGQSAYDAQGWPGGQPVSGIQPDSAARPDYGAQPGYGDGPGARAWVVASPQPAARRRRGRDRTVRLVAVVMLLAGIAGLGESLSGMATQLLPRQFSARQQQQILNWEVGNRWRALPAGKIFPAVVSFRAPSALGGGTQPLTATRIGIARQASCPAATDTAVAAVLTRSGCQAMLRATYVDATDSYVVTVGVAAFPGTAQASAAHGELASPGLADARGSGGGAEGVRAVSFKGTPASGFTDGRRQLSASTSAGTYVVFYTIGYADSRPRVQVSSDKYVYSEMTSLGAGVTQAVLSVLAAPTRAPHCPGTPGC